MRVADRLARRAVAWKELEGLLDRFSRFRRSNIQANEVFRLGELYREACADLMLAEVHDLPRDTVEYLHSLVGRAHSAVYRDRGYRLRDFGRMLLQDAPASLRRDPALRIAAAVFFGGFLICALLACGRPDFARTVVGDEFLGGMDQMYSEPIGGERADGFSRNDAGMAGFYIQNNTSIGLRCFAWGLLFGLGSLYQLLHNAILLGTVFGHMAGGPNAGRFFTFVTAHSGFELTAIVVSGGAGLQLGWGLIDTHGRTRAASLRASARGAMPAVGFAVVLFFLAAVVEGFISASSLPYAWKGAVLALSIVAIAAYLALGGRTISRPEADRLPLIGNRPAVTIRT
jgi:uncharacterized membrane protein SpoIIM required for sporulation